MFQSIHGHAVGQGQGLVADLAVDRRVNRPVRAAIG